MESLARWGRWCKNQQPPGLSPDGPKDTDMRTQLIQRLPTGTVKADGMWCALSLSQRSESSVLRSYLGSKVITTSHQASAFTARNPRNPEADHKAALD